MTEKTSSHANTDRVFATERLPTAFAFDDQVASVFEDMINRSVPGYSTIISMIGVLAERYCGAGRTIYDLGASLGGAAASSRVEVNSTNKLDQPQKLDGEREFASCRSRRL